MAGAVRGFDFGQVESYKRLARLSHRPRQCLDYYWWERRTRRGALNRLSLGRNMPVEWGLLRARVDARSMSERASSCPSLSEYLTCTLGYGVWQQAHFSPTAPIPHYLARQECSEPSLNIPRMLSRHICSGSRPIPRNLTFNLYANHLRIPSRIRRLDGGGSGRRGVTFLKSLHSTSHSQWHEGVSFLDQLDEHSGKDANGRKTRKKQGESSRFKSSLPPAYKDKYFSSPARPTDPSYWVKQLANQFMLASLDARSAPEARSREPRRLRIPTLPRGLRGHMDRELSIEMERESFIELPNSRQGELDKRIIGVTCPLEGSEHIVRQTVLDAAGLIDADVIRVDAVRTFGFGEYGDFGKHLNFADDSKSPLFLKDPQGHVKDSDSQSAAAEWASEMIQEGEDESADPEDVDGRVPKNDDDAYGMLYNRNLQTEHHLIASICRLGLAARGEQKKPRVLLIENAVPMSKFLHRFWSSFQIELDKIRALNEELDPSNFQPTICVFSCTPSIIHPMSEETAEQLANPHANSSSESSMTQQVAIRPPNGMPRALFEKLTSSLAGQLGGIMVVSSGSKDVDTKLWRGTHEEDSMARLNAWNARMNAFQLGDEK